MKKRIPIVLFLIIALVFAIGGLAACSSKPKITAECTAGGSVSVSTEKAEPGESITVTLTPDEGYTVESVLVNDEEAEVTDNTVTFYMPNTNVYVYATFGKIKYKVRAAEAAGGEITCNAEGYAEGDSAVITVSPDFGYALSALTVDGQTVQVTNNRYTLTMPAKDISVSATFATDAEVKALPSGSVLTLSAQAPAGEKATAEIYLEFNSDNLILSAYVEDSKVITEKDGLSLYFGTSDYAGGTVSDKNISVRALADGSVAVQKGSSGTYVSAEADGISSEVSAWSREEDKVTGYEIAVTVKYSAIGVTAEQAKTVLTLLPYLVNGDKTGLAFGAAESTIDEFYVYTDADTYPLVSDNGFKDNYYMFGSGELGSYKNIVTMGSKWNISNDSGEADRQAILEGHDNADNNVAFVHTAGKTAFAKATFEITEVYNSNEHYPKFGFMVYDTAKANSGIFFYADAEAAEGKTSGIGKDDLVGTSLGFSLQTEGAWTNWKTISDTEGSLNRITKQVTLAVTYNKGFVYMYVQRAGEDRQVAVTTYSAEGDIVIGIKSFGLGLKVTGYSATNDPSDSDFIGHNTRTDGVTVGDNDSGYAYTEGWSIIGDVAVNSGAGDQIIYIKDVTASAAFYAEADVTTPGKAGNMRDEYTKAGMVIVNGNYTVFGYYDLRDSFSAGDRIRTYFAVRKGNGSWIWDTGVTSRYATTVEDKTVKLGIAKIGATVYLLADGKVVASYTNAEIENEKFVPGVMAMNRSVTVTSGSGSTDRNTVNRKLGMAVPESVKFDGILDDGIWTEQVLSTKQTFAEKNGTKVEAVAVKGAEGVFAAVTLYTKTEQLEFPYGASWSDVCHVGFQLTRMTANDGDNANAHFIAFYKHLDGGVSTSVSFRNAVANVEEVTLSDGSSGYRTTVEFYIPDSYFGDYSPLATELPFYVWDCRIDKSDFPAMNITYKTTEMYVTENGLVLKTVQAA